MTNVNTEKKFERELSEGYAASAKENHEVALEMFEAFKIWEDKHGY